MRTGTRHRRQIERGFSPRRRRYKSGSLAFAAICVPSQTDTHRKVRSLNALTYYARVHTWRSSLIWRSSHHTISVIADILRVRLARKLVHFTDMSVEKLPSRICGTCSVTGPTLVWRVRAIAIVTLGRQISRKAHSLAILCKAAMSKITSRRFTTRTIPSR